MTDNPNKRIKGRSVLYWTIITAEDLGDEIKGKVIMPVTTSMQRSTPRASLRTALAALGADNTAYLPFGWHIKGWYKDPAYIVIDSLQLNMGWSSSSYPASTAHHIAYGWAAWAGLDRTHPQGARWHDYSKTSTTVTHHVQEEFVNSTFADYVYGAFGAAGWAACGFTFGDTARFYHDLGLAGNRNGWVQWYWSSHKRGACVDLTRLDYKSWN